MKRLVSILLLIIFLFNLCGYHLVFWGMEFQAKRKLLSRLEANSLEQDDLVVLTIPITLPYASNSEYEPVEGEFLHNGQYFKLVKQKYENDTLFIVCVKDATSSSIVKKLHDYSKIANSLPVGSKQAMNFIAKLYKDYHSIEFQYKLSGLTLNKLSTVALSARDFVTPCLSIDSPPPEA